MAEKSKSGKEAGTRAGGDEKVLIIPLRSMARKSARNMRMNRSVREIKAFLARHMRTEPSNVRISQQLNESLWKGGVHNPPSRIKIKVRTVEEGKIFASLLEEKERLNKESKKKLGLRERLRRKASETPSSEESARRREGSREEKPAEKKEEKPAVPEPPKEKTKKERPKETTEEIDQELMLQE